MREVVKASQRAALFPSTVAVTIPATFLPSSTLTGIIVSGSMIWLYRVPPIS